MMVLFAFRRVDLVNRKWFEKQVNELESVLQAQGADIVIPRNKTCEYEIPDTTNLAGYIDHTLLRPDAGLKDIEMVAIEGKQYEFASVCIYPRYVQRVARLLANTGVKVCTVIGFPFGANTTKAKVAEAKDALANGAEELDMVMSIGQFKSLDYNGLYRDIVAVKQAAGENILKVIIETSYLDDSEILKACLLAQAAKADFVKTSTGFATGGARVEAVELMRKAVGSTCGVKASGGIRDYKTAIKMLAAGANRIGTSAGVEIVKMSVGENNAQKD